MPIEALGMTTELFHLFATVAIVVVVMMIIAGVITLDRSRLRAVRSEFLERTRVGAPFIGLLVLVLAFNASFRRTAHDISWSIGLRITPLIVGLEGTSVAHIQRFFGEGMTWFFAFMYIYGYVFLLAFPLLLYFFLERLDAFKSLTTAYAANYAIGFACYVMFVAFGPRNTIPEIVGQGPLYDFYPGIHLLTSEINEYTNVFPSLHTSLSATVMYFAWRTRESFPVWTFLASVIGLAVIISTMYLALHWITDVVAGLVLAAVASWIGLKVIEVDWPKRVDPRYLRRRFLEEGR